MSSRQARLDRQRSRGRAGVRVPELTIPAFTLDGDDWRRAVSVSDGPLHLVGRAHVALRTPGEHVYDDDPDVRLLVSRMHATLQGRPIPGKPGYRTAHKGLALTAAQVGFPFSIVALLDGRTFMNAHVTPTPSSTTETALEGCLSIPGRWYAVTRARRVSVVARPLGAREASRFQVADLDARMWQHEADHLAGTLISDRWPASSTFGDTELPTGAVERMARNAELGGLLG